MIKLAISNRYRTGVTCRRRTMTHGHQLQVNDVSYWISCFHFLDNGFLVYSFNEPVNRWPTFSDSRMTHPNAVENDLSRLYIRRHAQTDEDTGREALPYNNGHEVKEGLRIPDALGVGYSHEWWSMPSTVPHASNCAQSAAHALVCQPIMPQERRIHAMANTAMLVVLLVIKSDIWIIV
ncbi:hypothetical protein ACGC1H_000526 [Rhizoctonia solani]